MNDVLYYKNKFQFVILIKRRLAHQIAYVCYFLLDLYSDLLMESQLIASYNTKLMVIVNEENYYCTRCQTFQVVQKYQAFCIDDEQTFSPNETICSQYSMF